MQLNYILVNLDNKRFRLIMDVRKYFSLSPIANIARIMMLADRRFKQN